MDRFSIRSTKTDKVITFSNRDGEYFNFELKGREIEFRRRVTTYTDEFGVSKLFRKVASYNKPWSGVESWESIEGELGLSLECDSLGHVTIRVTVTQWDGGEEDWHIKASILTDLGQLDKVAKNAVLFFNG